MPAAYALATPHFVPLLICIFCARRCRRFVSAKRFQSHAPNRLDRSSLEPHFLAFGDASFFGGIIGVDALELGLAGLVGLELHLADGFGAQLPPPVLCLNARLKNFPFLPSFSQAFTQPLDGAWQ
jgi:hypothetical protein